jgi:hypothetical protein
MVLLGDEAQVEAHFSQFGYSANPDTRQVHSLRWTYHRLTNHFGCTRWNSYVTWVMWNLISIRLETMLVFVQDSWTVCAKPTIGSEIILDTPDGTPWWQSSCRSLFWYVSRLCYYWRNLGAWFAQNVPWARKSFWTHPMELLGDLGHVESRFGADTVSVGAW